MSNITRIHQCGRLVAFHLILALLPTVAIAEVKTWDSQGSDNRWRNDANWNPDGKPTLDDDVRINAGADLNVELDFNSSTAVLLPMETFAIDFQVARVVEIGLGPAEATVMMAEKTGFSLGTEGAVKIGQSGTLQITAPAMFRRGADDYAVVENDGAVEILASENEEEYIKMADFLQTPKGRLTIQLPPFRDLDEIGDSPLLGVLGPLSLEGALHIVFPPGYAPTHTDFPTTTGDQLITGFLSSDTAFIVTIQGQVVFERVVSQQSINDVGDGKFHPGPNGGVVAQVSVAAIEIGLRAAVLGDMDGNGVVDAFDVDDFELALANRAAYSAIYPDIDPDFVGDINNSGSLDAFDIAPFEQLLAGQGSLVDPQVFVQMLKRLLIE